MRVQTFKTIQMHLKSTIAGRGHLPPPTKCIVAAVGFYLSTYV